MGEVALGWVVAVVLLAMLAVPVIVGVRRSHLSRERRRRWEAADGTGAAGFYAGGWFDGSGGGFDGGGDGGGD